MTDAPRLTAAIRLALSAAVFAPLCLSAPASGAAAPTLWGYGVKSCGDFLAAAPGAGAPATLGGDEYVRYREWLAGLISGLNLATDSDVLRGAELEAALGRIRTHCEAHPRDDVFKAAITLIRSLRGDPGPAPRKAK